MFLAGLACVASHAPLQLHSEQNSMCTLLRVRCHLMQCQQTPPERARLKFETLLGYELQCSYSSVCFLRNNSLFTENEDYSYSFTVIPRHMFKLDCFRIFVTPMKPYQCGFLNNDNIHQHVNKNGGNLTNSTQQRAAGNQWLLREGKMVFSRDELANWFPNPKQSSLNI